MVVVLFFLPELATDLLKPYQRAHNQAEQNEAMQQLRQELLVKEEELGRLSEQFAEQQQECHAIQSELDKEKAKEQQLETATEELVGI